MERPDSFDFAMDFLGSPESEEMIRYVEKLELINIEGEKMTSFEQMQKMKQNLFNDLTEVVNKHKVHVGAALCETDVIGIIEKVKLDYHEEMNNT